MRKIHPCFPPLRSRTFFAIALVAIALVPTAARSQTIGQFKQPYILDAISSDYSTIPNIGNRVFRFRVGDRVTVQVGPQASFNRYYETLRLVNNKEKTVRLATVLDLKEYKTIKAARAITSRLGDASFEVRETAAWALGEMGYRGSIRPLIDSLAYTPGPVKATIARSLRKLTGKDFGSSYRRWWAWYDSIRRDS